MKYKIKLECPYCGHQNSITLERNFDMQVIVCDTDCGGCDRNFVFKPTVKIEVDVYKIERNKK